MANKKTSGVKTLFNDSKGDPIHVHDYVKDSAGNCYFINSHYQAVPAIDSQDAAATSLVTLLEQGSVTIMSAAEVLAMKAPVETKHRAGRKPSGPACDSSPVDESLLLSVIEDSHLVAELRRRGYCVTAVKPALIQL